MLLNKAALGVSRAISPSKMVLCFAPGSNYKIKESSCKFYRFPKSRYSALKWRSLRFIILMRTFISLEDESLCGTMPACLHSKVTAHQFAPQRIFCQRSIKLFYPNETFCQVATQKYAFYLLVHSLLLIQLIYRIDTLKIGGYYLKHFFLFRLVSRLYLIYPPD